MDHREYIRLVPESDTAVLLIHGICGSPAHFRHLLPLIPENWSVCNLLLDGHGRNVQDFAATSMKKWKAQVSRHLEQLRSSHRRVLIAGHSLGTLLAIEEAIKNSDKIEGLFLLNVPIYVHLPPATMLCAIRSALGMDRYLAVKDMLDDCSITLTPRLWEYIGWVPRFCELLAQTTHIRKLLPNLEVPARCFHSVGDELVSRRSCPSLEAHPAIKLTLLPQSGHFQYKGEDLQLLQEQFQKWLHE